MIEDEFLQLFFEGKVLAAQSNNHGYFRLFEMTLIFSSVLHPQS